jgi:hypothetical protein
MELVQQKTPFDHPDWIYGRQAGVMDNEVFEGKVSGFRNAMQDPVMRRPQNPGAGGLSSATLGCPI